MNQPVPQAPQLPQMSMDELYRQYGEATIQFKLAQGKVMLIEQQIQQALNNPTQK